MNVSVLHKLLVESNYDPEETRFLVEGFTNGFNLGYQGPWIRKDESRNIPFQVGVGSKEVMWEKIMKEVKEGRYASPYENIPFKNYMQSPIGLVPKAGGQTRLIFHLSYSFKSGLGSLNGNTLHELCTVKYNDLDVAVCNSYKWAAVRLPSAQVAKSQYMAKSLEIGNKRKNLMVFYSKTDLKSTFRILPLKKSCYPWVVLKAYHPVTGKLGYFIKKNLPFGASISCSHFQRFSNCLKHILEYMTGMMEITCNYLDDFLFYGPTARRYNQVARTFLKLCKDIGVPVGMEKTVWATKQITFLGIELDGEHFKLRIPQEKKLKALNWIQFLTSKKSVKIKDLEKVTGYFNFLAKVIVPGRTFTRRMYAKFTGKFSESLKPYHHVRIDKEFREDVKVWESFLLGHLDQKIARPFEDLLDEDDENNNLVTLQFHSDASANENLGFGAIFDSSYLSQRWEPGFIRKFNPSIEFLELYALVVAVFTWIHKLKNSRCEIFCDNEAVVKMLHNSYASSCKYCMVLIRKLVLKCIEHNCRIYPLHVKGKENFLSDSLSRMKSRLFFCQARKIHRRVDLLATLINRELWPLSELWKRECLPLN